MDNWPTISFPFGRFSRSYRWLPCPGDGLRGMSRTAAERDNDIIKFVAKKVLISIWSQLSNMFQPHFCFHCNCLGDIHGEVFRSASFDNRTRTSSNIIASYDLSGAVPKCSMS